MYRLLIVDDEPVIVDGLYEFFLNKDDLNIDVYRAYSGTEALYYLNCKKIDIVLADICMPDINGLSLLKKIHANWPQCRIIFYTGYDEFDYVYTAIKHSGVSYILKTESYDEVLMVVQKNIYEIEKSQMDIELINKAKTQMSLTTSVVQKEFVWDLLQGEITEVSQQQLDMMNISLRVDEPVLLIVGSFDELPFALTRGEKAQYYYAVKMIAEECFGVHFSFIRAQISKSLIVWLLQPKTLELQEIEAGNGMSQRAIILAKGALEFIQQRSKKSLELTMSFVMTWHLVGWHETKDRFQKLEVLINQCHNLGMETIITDDTYVKMEADWSLDSNIISQKLNICLKELSMLENLLDHGKTDAFENGFMVMMSHIYKITFNNYSFLMQALYQISLFFLGYINKKGISSKISAEIHIGRLSYPEVHASWEEQVDYFTQLARRIFRINDTKTTNRGENTVAFIKKHIHENIREDLSLVKLAELVYFNPTYLSRIFRESTGVNLSDYINKVRFDKVVELMKQNQIRIHEAGAQVGYGTAACFTRFFKKASGMTPQEYREHLMKSGCN